MKKRALAAALLASLMPPPAWADEGLQVIAASGNWFAVVHKESSISPPDVCGAGSGTSGLVLRIDSDTAEIRMQNEKWSLPANVVGQMTIAVGDWKKTYDIVENTANMVTSLVDKSDMESMITAMDKAASMSVTVGNAAPIPVSLSGSTVVTNAFRTCAGLHGNAATPGSNPFQ